MVREVRDLNRVRTQPAGFVTADHINDYITGWRDEDDIPEVSNVYTLANGNCRLTYKDKEECDVAEKLLHALQ